jgi:hypothetical protein
MSEFEERIIELLEELVKNTTPPAKPKRRSSKKVKEDEVPKEVKELAKYYKDLGLKNPGLTIVAKEWLEDVIKEHGFDAVKDAMRFSAETWYAREMESGGYFRNIQWFCKNIEGFLPGGKYRMTKVEPSKAETKVIEYDLF